MSSPILYELNTRTWLRELMDRVSPESSAEDLARQDAQRLKRLGFTGVWLMGIWHVGEGARDVALNYWNAEWKEEIPSGPENVLGSPYAIFDYEIDLKLRTPALTALIESLREKGITVICDFVPNHFSIDAWVVDRFPSLFVQSISARPGTYSRKTKFGKRHFAHGKDPHFPPWEDTVQVDFRKESAHQGMRRLLTSWTNRFGGFRCDMAMLVLPEVFEKTWESFPVLGSEPVQGGFWERAIEDVKSLNPNSLLIAEVYWDMEERLQNLGFDFTYNKRFYDFLVRGQFYELQQFLLQQRPGFLSRSVHFLENHDEPRIASLMLPRLQKAAAVLLLGMPGMALLHDGQLEGRKAFARIQMNIRAPETPDAEVEKFYRRLLATIPTTHVRQGRGTILQVSEAEAGNDTWRNAVVVAWENARAGETDVVVVNLGGAGARVRIHLPSPGPSDSAVQTLFASDGELPSAQVQRQDLILEMPAESGAIFRVRRAG